ncbi:hypothetical protein EDD36DRAFT_475661 [Exophiala viscosa]|uniref:Heterokaryon incompatibility domain-containing protein n=1 Tax=Exophiala viscosa TaxID=2486360 RepID=A0AAN6DUY0_9EURO|nr:hypothetical protein EDD36DRAFT_475661 [Exophiala viscosa]
MSKKGEEQFGELVHHLSYEALALSAKSGCALSRLLSAGAEEKELQVDKDFEENADSNPPPFVVSGVHGLPLKYNRLDFFEQKGHMLFGFRYKRKATIVQGDPMRGVFVTACPGHVAMGSVFVGRKISVNPDLTLGKVWIDNCINQHVNCLKNNENWFPTRVIDIGPTDGSADPHLVLGSGLQGHYVTLSHRWGNMGPLTTITDTYEKHMNSIPLHSLPTTFRDAVQVTRSLNDSTEDWRKECIAMPQIYSNSLVTLAGPKASNPFSGFLHDRNLPQISPCDLKWHFLGDEKGFPLSLVYQRNGGAWVLQERLLSQRVLYFGSEMMYWECNSRARYEVLGYPIEDDYQNRNEVEKRSFKELRDRDSWLGYWYNIVETYSQCDLTRETDKLPALSGIARVLYEILGDTYVAGVWSGDIPRGLAWCMPTYQKQLVPVRPTEYTAPSWSFASVQHRIDHINNNHAYQLRDKDLAVLSHQVELESDDQFSCVTKAKLRVYGRLGKVFITNHEHEFKGRLNLKMWAIASEPYLLGDYNIDDHQAAPPLMPSNEDNAADDCLKEVTLLCLGRFIANDDFFAHISTGIQAPDTTTKKRPSAAKDAQVRPTTNSFKTAWENVNVTSRAREVRRKESREYKFATTWTAIAIEPVHGETHCYKRIGIATGSTREVPDRSMADAWFDSFDTKQWIDIV